MSAPPLNRDEQIEMLRTARERHAGHVARWMADGTVQALVSEPPPPETPSADTFTRSSRLVARCA